MGIEAGNPGNGYPGTRLSTSRCAITQVSEKRVPGYPFAQVQSLDRMTLIESSIVSIAIYELKSTELLAELN